MENVMRLSKVEVVFLDEHQGWDTMVVTIPEKIAETQSQDAFIKWVYSDEGEGFRKTWHKDVMSVYVMSWRADLEASGHPEVVEDSEPDVLFERDASGKWRKHKRDDDNDVAIDAFITWDHDERTFFNGKEHTTLFKRDEVEGHMQNLRKLVEKGIHKEWVSEIHDIRDLLEDEDNG